jgi:hypothetical protein
VITPLLDKNQSYESILNLDVFDALNLANSFNRYAELKSSVEWYNMENPADDPTGQRKKGKEPVNVDTIRKLLIVDD